MGYFKVTKKQEGGGESISVSYLKWQITKTRSTPAGGYLQASEFYIYRNAVKYAWSNNVSISSNMNGNTDQEISKLIDGNTGTKYCTPSWGETQTNTCNITITLGETITLDGHCAYSYVTGEDEESRDPVSWTLYGSSDGTNWTILDSRLDATISTSRQTETVAFPMSNLGGSSVQMATGSFTSGSEAQQKVEINCGFRPDYVEVKMEFESGYTYANAYYETRGTYYRSSWDLRPIEGVVYDIGMGSTEGETGITDFTSTGFKYRVNSGNTQNKPCTYIAIKFTD